MNRVTIFFLIFMSITLVVDVYFYFGIKSFLQNWKYERVFNWVYWSVTAFVIGYYILGLILWNTGNHTSGSFRTIIQAISFCLLLPKLLGSIFFLVDDVIRLFRWLTNIIIGLFDEDSTSATEEGISRLKFLQLTGLGVFGAFFGLLSYGVLRGAYQYNVIRQKLKLQNLPRGFEGMKVIQISDLHVGSFMSSAPLERAVQLINDQQPDMIFFTGDLVNDIAEEALEYLPTLKKLKAKHGVYSILGNHDYGDYFYDKNDTDYQKNKQHNKELMKQIHKDAGWNLMLDEHQIFEDSEGGKLAVIGIENYAGKGSFARYGDLHKAYKGSEDAQVKLLLSHDPSHWDQQVRKEFKDIDATFSGHTHGMQFGIEIPGIKWSPVQWMYKQWAGLYEKDNQKLYVNRGLGFVGYPGRVGILPEITVFELVKG